MQTDNTMKEKKIQWNPQSIEFIQIKMEGSVSLLYLKCQESLYTINENKSQLSLGLFLERGKHGSYSEKYR